MRQLRRIMDRACPVPIQIYVSYLCILTCETTGCISCGLPAVSTMQSYRNNLKSQTTTNTACQPFLTPPGFGMRTNPTTVDTIINGYICDDEHTFICCTNALCWINTKWTFRLRWYGTYLWQS